MRLLLIVLLSASLHFSLADPEDEAREHDCSFITYNHLKQALSNATCGSLSGQCASGASGSGNGGLNFNMWGTVVNRHGRVCQVVYTGPTNTDQWPGSRVISAQKANTGNAFSLSFFALSSANLYQPTQPGGTLFGLQESNPVDTSVAYGGNSVDYGRACGSAPPDPMCRKKIGGINVFGGGLALYDYSGTLLGGLGVSGDTSCADHNIAWRTRHNLQFDYVPGGVADGTDNIIFPASAPFGHPSCGQSVVTPLPPPRHVTQGGNA